LPEYQVSQYPIIDYEFDWGRDGNYCPSCNGGDGNNRLVFSDFNERLWVAHVDPVTGAFVPASGQEEQVDTNAAYAKDFGNGPEWMFGSAGSQLVYTKYIPGVPQSHLSGAMALAQNVGGTWSAGIVDTGQQRQSPMGTVDIDDPAPRINYLSYSLMLWRTATDAASEKVVAQSWDGSATRRWVPGTHKIVYTGPHNAQYQQVFSYDTDAGTLEQLTFDDVQKAGVFMWQAPEYNNEYVFFTVAYNGTVIQIYRNLDDGTGVKKWSVVYSVTMPSELPYVFSPEPFVYKGHSFIFFQLSTGGDILGLTTPNQLAMVSADGSAGGFRMLTNDVNVKRVRTDPEYYITANGPYIYYNRYVPKTDTFPGAQEGVWRVDTYLGP